MRTLSTLLLAAATALPLAAQQREKTPAPAPTEQERTPVRVWINGQDMSGRLAPLMQRRARLGISVSLEKRETDSIGAYVQSVTPGGPAAKAGLQSGDVIVRLDGKAVLSATGRAVDEEESLAGVRLVEMAAKLEPNDTIKVDVQRSGQRKTVTLVTGDEPLVVMGESVDGRSFVFRMPEGGPMEGMRMPGPTFERTPAPGMQWEMRSGSPGATAVFVGGGALGNLELAPLNPDLGSYFGTTEGILVIRAPASSSLGLKGGDVVLTVDGRKPSSPSSLMRILRSYDQNESFKLEILRQKKPETITGKLDSRNPGEDGEQE